MCATCEYCELLDKLEEIEDLLEAGVADRDPDMRAHLLARRRGIMTTITAYEAGVIDLHL